MDNDNKKLNASKKGFSAPIKKAEKDVISNDVTQTSKKKQKNTSASTNKKDCEKKEQLKPLFTSSPDDSSDKMPKKQKDINNMKDSSPNDNKHKKKILLHVNVSPIEARHLIPMAKKKCSTKGERLKLKGVKFPKVLSENEYEELFNSVLQVSEDAEGIKNNTLTENEYNDIFNSVIQKTSNSNDPESNIDDMKKKVENKKSIKEVSVDCEETGMKVKVKSPGGFEQRGLDENNVPLQDNYSDINDDNSSIDSEEVDDWNDMPVQQENETTPVCKPKMECPKIRQGIKKVEKQNKLKPKQLLYSETEQIIKAKKGVADGQSSKEITRSSDKKGITRVTSKKGKKEINPISKKIKKYNQVLEKQAKREETVVYEQDETGTWVQCCNKMCNKWRYVQEIEDPLLVPEDWECKMNSDKDHNSCDLPEVNYDESDHILTKFTVGSIVWAKMDGYPWWPGMIEIDPDYGIYFEVPTEASMVPTQYNVTFFGDNVTRAWMKSSLITPYGSGHPKSKFPVKHQTYKRELQAAKKIADSALEFKLQDRLKKFGFAQNHSKRTRHNKIESKQDKMIKPTNKKQKKVLKITNDVILKSDSAKTAMEKLNNSDVFSDDSLENVEYLPIKSKSRSGSNDHKLILFDKTADALNVLGKGNNSDATTTTNANSLSVAIKTDISKINSDSGKLLEGEKASNDEASSPQETNKLNKNKYNSSEESISGDESNAFGSDHVKNAAGIQEKNKCITEESQVEVENKIINDSDIKCKNNSDDEDTLILDDSENEKGKKKQKLPWKLTSRKANKTLHKLNQNNVEDAKQQEMDCYGNHKSAEEKFDFQKETKKSKKGRENKKAMVASLSVQRNLIDSTITCQEFTNNIHSDNLLEKVQDHDKNVDDMKNENDATSQSNSAKRASKDSFVKEKSDAKMEIQKKRKEKDQKESELTLDTTHDRGEEMGGTGNKVQVLKSNKSLSVKTKVFDEKKNEDYSVQCQDLKNNTGSDRKIKPRKRKASISKENDFMLQSEENEFSSSDSKTLKKKKGCKEKGKDIINNNNCDNLKIPCNGTEMSDHVSPENSAHQTEKVQNRFEDVLKMEVKSDKQNKAPSRKRKSTTANDLDNCPLQKQSNEESSKMESKKRKDKSCYMANEQLKKGIELEVKDLKYDSDKENVDPNANREDNKATLHTKDGKGKEDCDTKDKNGEKEKKREKTKERRHLSLKNKKSRAINDEKPENCLKERRDAFAEKDTYLQNTDQTERTSKQIISLKNSDAKLQEKDKQSREPCDSDNESNKKPIPIDEKLSDPGKKKKNQKTVGFSAPILKEKKSSLPKTHINAAMSKDLKEFHNVSELPDRQVPVGSQDKTVTGVNVKTADYEQDQHVVPDLYKEMTVDEEDEIILNNKKIESKSSLISLKGDVEHNSEKDELDLNFNPNLVDKTIPEKILNDENSSDDDSQEFTLYLDDEEEGTKVVVESVRDFGRFGGRCYEHGSDSDPLELIEE